MTGKNIPIRTCIVCRREFEKKELLRIVKTKDGNFRADKTGKADGRGAYICRSPECFNKLLKTKFLNKVFKTFEEITGKENCKVAAVTDENLAKAILQNLGEDFRVLNGGHKD